MRVREWGVRDKKKRRERKRGGGREERVCESYNVTLLLNYGINNFVMVDIKISYERKC